MVLEGVFKFKELVYMYVEGFVVGEFKYGLIVLIEDGLLVIVVMFLFKGLVMLYVKLLFNICEI